MSAPIFTNLKKRFEHVELPAKLLDYFLRSNKSNINQVVEFLILRKLFGHITKHVESWMMEISVLKVSRLLTASSCTCVSWHQVQVHTEFPAQNGGHEKNVRTCLVPLRGLDARLPYSTLTGGDQVCITRKGDPALRLPTNHGQETHLFYIFGLLHRGPLRTQR